MIKENIIEFECKKVTGESLRFAYELTGEHLYFDKRLLLNILSQNDIKVEEVDKENLYIYVPRILKSIILRKVRLFNKISLDVKSIDQLEMSAVTAMDIDLSLISLKIGLLAVYSSNLTVKNCVVRHLVSSPIVLDDIKEPIKTKGFLGSIKMFRVTVDEVNLSGKLLSLQMENCTVESLTVDLDSKSDINVNLSDVFVNKRLQISSDIDVLNLTNSFVEKIVFGECVIINNYIDEMSNVKSCFFCEVDTIKKKSIGMWRLVRSSSIALNDYKTAKRAGYEIEKGTGPRNIARWLYKVIVGYGYIPFRAILFSITVILIFAFLYSVFEGTMENSILDKVYLSGMAFTTTGFGDISPVNTISRVLTIIESFIGISVFAMFVYSVTKNIKE